MLKMRIAGVVVLALFCMGASECQPPASSTSGVGKAYVKLEVGSDGFTAEQRNIRDRLVEDNKPGAIKHLYVISPYSGQVILYSTVRGKVTSGSKRLNPSTVVDIWEREGIGFSVNFGDDVTGITQEVLGDDGAYGHSGDYVFWWDAQGRYHQHYLGNEILHISDQPLPVKSVIINVSGAE